MAIPNTLTYKTAFESAMQERLARPQTWKEMVKVDVTNDRVISTSYMSTVPAVTTVVRDTGLVLTAFEETAQSLTISTGRDLGLFLDWGDYYQSPWTTTARLFADIGDLLNEFIEANVLAQHASWTDFGTSSIGAGGSATTPITVSASNIDDIIRGVRREVREANGQAMMKRNGLGFTWRAADFEYLEAFSQAWNKIVGLYKSLLIDLETQKWAIRRKQALSWAA